MATYRWDGREKRARIIDQTITNASSREPKRFEFDFFMQITI